MAGENERTLPSGRQNETPCVAGSLAPLSHRRLVWLGVLLRLLPLCDVLCRTMRMRV